MLKQSGFSANNAGSNYNNLTLRAIEIGFTSDPGSCFDLGCDGDACRVNGALIENSYCHDTCSQSDCASGSRGAGIHVRQLRRLDMEISNLIPRSRAAAITSSSATTCATVQMVFACSLMTTMTVARTSLTVCVSVRFAGFNPHRQSRAQRARRQRHSGTSCAS